MNPTKRVKTSCDGMKDFQLLGIQKGKAWLIQRTNQHGDAPDV